MPQVAAALTGQSCFVVVAAKMRLSQEVYPGDSTEKRRLVIMSASSPALGGAWPTTACRPVSRRSYPGRAAIATTASVASPFTSRLANTTPAQLHPHSSRRFFSTHPAITPIACQPPIHCTTPSRFTLHNRLNPCPNHCLQPTSQDGQRRVETRQGLHQGGRRADSPGGGPCQGSQQSMIRPR